MINNHPLLRRFPSVPLTIAIASLVFASCGSGQSDGANAPSHQTPEEFGLYLRDLTARVEATEASIAECMSAAGFEYVAVDFATIKTAMDGDQSAAGVSDEDYVKQFGFGITTQFDKPLIVFRAGPVNNAVLDVLPESEQTAYRRALWGEAPDWNHAHAVEAEDLSQTGGCTRTAAEQHYATAELAGNYLNPFDKLVEQDPRFLSAVTKWSACIRKAGFDFDNTGHVERELQQRLADVTQGQDPRTLDASAAEALRALQGEELAIAAAAYDCEEQHIQPVQDMIEADRTRS